MNGLTRFLDWLDEAAAGFIRLAYLLAGITAVALYFGAGHLPAFIEDPLNSALPWSLAAAVETHTYITARRVRAAWQEKNWTSLKVNLGILAGLLAFSAWNQLNYLAETWQPPVGAIPLPPFLAYLVRALIVPCAFMAAAFLAPMAEPVTAQIENEARATLHDVFRIARKQRRRLLKAAERDGRDMTGALVELVEDPDTRRIISHAYGAIGAPIQSVPVPVTDTPMIVEATPAPSSVQIDASTPPGVPPQAVAQETPEDAPSETLGATPIEPMPPVEFTPWELVSNKPPEPFSRPPTGGGSPSKKPRTGERVKTPAAGVGSNVVTMAPRTRRSRGKNAPKRVARGSAEPLARMHFTPGMSAGELARLSGLSKGSASKWRHVLQAEADTTQADDQADQAAQ